MQGTRLWWLGGVVNPDVCSSIDEQLLDSPKEAVTRRRGTWLTLSRVVMELELQRKAVAVLIGVRFG